jgi:hypothetical protein
MAQILFGIRAKRREGPAHRVEFARCRALKREDRLLFVTHREDGAANQPRPGADEEFRRERLDDSPLLRAGVLRFVDQNVVYTAIELVMNPGGIDPLEQFKGPVDQVLIVEERATVLFGLVAIDHSRGHRDQCGGTVPGQDGLAPLPEGDDTVALGLEFLGESGLFLGNGLGEERLARFAFVGQENAAISLSPFGAGQSARRGPGRPWTRARSWPPRSSIAVREDAALRWFRCRPARSNHRC